MASTNHTTNYQLSQFAQTDKPAWLGDYNQDMTKIDTQMKANADAVSTVSTTVSAHTTAIAGNTSDIATAQADITALDTRVTAVETKNTEQDTAISNAQTDATSALGASATNTENIAQQALDITSLQNDTQTNATAIAGNTASINTLSGKIDEVISEMVPSVFSSIESPTTVDGVQTHGLTKIYLAQSPKSTVFKVYGRLDIHHGSGSYTYSRHAIPGLSGYYGIKTTLKLAYPPQASYMIEGAGIEVAYTPGTQDDSPRYGTTIAVDTDGYIWLNVKTSNTETLSSNQRYVMLFNASLYFNSSFGDIPHPEQNA